MLTAFPRQHLICELDDLQLAIKRLGRHVAQPQLDHGVGAAIDERVVRGRMLSIECSSCVQHP
eukprot:2140210-Pyramimonas_sp.AAC.1